MTQSEAIYHMGEGEKVTHRFFTENEWVKLGEPGYYILEDGVTVPENEFWRYRDGSEWLNDWEIWKDKNPSAAEEFLKSLKIIESTEITFRCKVPSKNSLISYDISEKPLTELLELYHQQQSEEEKRKEVIAFAEFLDNTLTKQTVDGNPKKTLAIQWLNTKIKI